MLWFLSVLCILSSVFALNDNLKPNIIIILMDDLGHADLGYMGSQIKTPNIDALANEGVKLESYYGLPVCTPARAALMTGRYPMRYGLQTLVIFPSHTYGLPTEEKTLAEYLKEAGYTTALVGKWHLGHADKKFWPQNRGFNSFYGNLVGEVDYFTKERGGITDWQRDGKFFKEEGYYTELIGNEAVKIINEQVKSKPFFLYVASLAPHAPYQVPEKYSKSYANVFSDKVKQEYAGMITAMDEQVGRIVQALKERDLLNNTLIFFSTDNGGATNALFATGARSPEERSAEKGEIPLGSTPPASNAPFRGGKGSLYDGGVHVPAFFYWPVKFKPGVILEPAGHIDVLPTLIDIAGWKGTVSNRLDGVSLLPLLLGEKKSLDRDILINVEPIRGAIRKGNWKLIKIALLPGRTELYDLSKDPEEKNNVADKNPEVVKELEKLLNNYAKEQKQSEWIKAQVQFIGAQGKTVLDPDLDIDDSGLPNEKPQFPDNL